MKKTLLICSDIQGTYNALDNQKQIEMLKSIEDIRIMLELDQTVFCFVSRLCCEEIEQIVNDNLLPLLEETKLNTIVGPQFGIDGYSYNGSIPKQLSKDNAKGTQMANFINAFSTIIPDSKVNHFIYIDDHPNINPLLFLQKINKNNNDLQSVNFLVKSNDFNKFIVKEDYTFNINVIENRMADFAMLGIKEICKRNDYTKRTS